MKKRLYGLANLYVGDVQDDGLMPLISEMTEMGEILPESVDIAKEDDTFSDLTNQETSDVDLSILSVIGAEAGVFATRNFRYSNLKLAFGGFVKDGKWNESTSGYKGKNKSMLMIGRAAEVLHQIVAFPKTLTTAKMQGGLIETETATLLFKMTKLTPKNEAGVKQTPKYIYSQPASPEFGEVNDTLKTFEFTDVESFSDATEYEYSTDGGVTFSDCTSFSIDVSLAGAIAIGDLLVRVKENLDEGVDDGDVDNKFVAGFALANEEPFTV